MAPRFTKLHGLGNDYLVVESDQLTGIHDLGAWAQRVCDRHFGAGADGVAVVAPEQTGAADFVVRIFNPDGSEANLSGNGTRCAAAYLHYNQIWTKSVLRLSTRSGIKRYFLRDKPGKGQYLFESELGEPRFDSLSVPMLTDRPMEQVVNYPLQVNGQVYSVTALQMGNPNCCLFIDNFDELDWRSIGKKIETHPQFPDRTNVVFIRVIDRQTLELRIWERGVGETTASGTCSCAGAIAAMVRAQVEKTVRVLMPGGEAGIQWREDGQVVITGTAAVVYSAVWLA